MRMSAHERAVLLLGGAGLIRVPRPALITWLAVLEIGGGSALLVMVAAFAPRLGPLAVLLGFSPSYVALSLLFLGSLSVAAGVGMWRGTKWGWWLAAFFFAYAIYRNVNVLVTLPTILDQLVGETGSPRSYYIKHGGRVFLNAGLLYCMFQDEVLRYFGLRGIHKGKALARLAIPLAFILGAQLLSMR